MAVGDESSGLETVSEAVLARLRARILTGAYPPGAVLRQEELARQFGASRVPLREAMTRLEAEGLLVLRPRRGYAVTSLDPAEVNEIFELRAVVEEHLGRVAARTRTPDDIAAAADTVSRMELIAAETPADIEAWLEVNAEFHAVLLGAAHRQHAGRFARMLRSQVEPYVRVEIGLTRDVLQAEREHGAMLDALTAGRAPELGRLCRLHCLNTAARLTKALDRRHDGR